MGESLLVLVAIWFVMVSAVVIMHYIAKQKGKRPALLLFKLVTATTALLFVLFGGFDFDSDPVVVIVGGLLAGAFAAALCVFYFIPYMIAESNNSNNRALIFCLNLFFGWTLLVWIVLLIVALIEKKPSAKVSQDEVPVEARLANLYTLYQQGAITAQEYEIKKQELLRLS